MAGPTGALADPADMAQASSGKACLGASHTETSRHRFLQNGFGGRWTNV